MFTCLHPQPTQSSAQTRKFKHCSNMTEMSCNNYQIQTQAQTQNTQARGAHATMTALEKLDNLEQKVANLEKIISRNHAAVLRKFNKIESFLVIICQEISAKDQTSTNTNNKVNTHSTTHFGQNGRSYTTDNQAITNQAEPVKTRTQTQTLKRKYVDENHYYHQPQDSDCSGYNTNTVRPFITEPKFDNVVI